MTEEYNVGELKLFYLFNAYFLLPFLDSVEFNYDFSFYWPARGFWFCVNILLVIILWASQLLIYAYYGTLRLLYRHTVDCGFGKKQDRKSWCKENGIGYYDFTKFHPYTGDLSSILLYSDDTELFIGFRKEADAVAFKLRWS